MKKVYDFDDTDMPLYYKYTEWLKECDYCVSTVGKHIRILRSCFEMIRLHSLCIINFVNHFKTASECNSPLR